MKRDNPFWLFSIDRYRRDGAAPALLALQEQAGADVNLVLFAFWLGSRGEAVADAQAGSDILQMARDWHERIVRPLRSARQAMKNWPCDDEAGREALRERLKGIEIDSEKFEQNLLYGAYLEKNALWTIRSDEPAERLMTRNARLMQPLPETARDCPLEKAARICV